MSWFLPERHRKSIREWQKRILSEEIPIATRRKILYKLLSTALGWVRDALEEQCGLEPEEIESELFILCSTLLEEFDPKGKLLFFIETRLPWKVSGLLKRLSSSPEEPVGLKLDLGYSYPEEEMWPSIPKFLLENRWMTKGLSIYEKTLILKLLTLETPNCRSIAEEFGRSKTSINEDLQILAGKMKERF